MSSKNKRIIKTRAAKTQAKSKILQQLTNQKINHNMKAKNGKEEQILPQKFEAISFMVRARDLLSQIRYQIGYKELGTQLLQLQFRHLTDMSFASVLAYQLENPRAYPGILINWDRNEKTWDGSQGTVRAKTPDGFMKLDFDWIYLQRSVSENGDMYYFVDISGDNPSSYMGRMPEFWDIRFSSRAFAEAFRAETIPIVKIGSVTHKFYLHDESSPIVDFEINESSKKSKIRTK